MRPTGTMDGGERLFQEILAGVEHPSRYIGGEWNSIVKDHRRVDVTFALAFPDAYEIGMSHLGFRILYSLLNAREDTAAERVFCPWPDMADALRRHGMPLRTLETGTPLRDFRIVGFSLQYEMTFTNVLEMLDLGGIPLRSRDRTQHDPLVIAGGPAAFNPEPMADFFDFFVVGDGEEVLPELLERLKSLASASVSREEAIRDLARIEGIYAPALYGTDLDSRSGLLVPVSADAAPYPVKRRIALGLDRFPFPERIVVPHGEIVHDRVSVEIMRGCPTGCRFCQAGYVYRPTRERDPNGLRDTVVRSIRATGYDEFSLASLNSGEYGAIVPLLLDLMDRFEPESVSVSLSSLHASSLTRELAEQVRRVRKSGFTIAPEAGTQRLRDAINKNLTEEQILEACRLAFEAGFDLLKLYFMIGLPTETDEDVDAIANLAEAVLTTARKAARGKRAEVTLSASFFVPKAMTPFQWRGMERPEQLLRKQRTLGARLRKGIRFKHHDLDTSLLEAVFSRGDRRLGSAVLAAWRDGARFDGWTERFRIESWRKAFGAAGIDPGRYAHGDWDPDGPLPWDVVDPGVTKPWLARELEMAIAGVPRTPCAADRCHGCAPFAPECTRGIVAAAAGRRLLPDLGEPGDRDTGGRGTVSSEEPPAGPVEAATRSASPAAASESRYRYRLRYEKTGRMRFLGHLDLTRTLLRAMRRASVSLAYTQGFNPKPRVSFGPALPVGVASEGEYLDIETTRRLDASPALDEINAMLPGGLRFLQMREIRRSAPGLGESIRAARYRVETRGEPDVVAALDAFESRADRTLQRERNGKVLTWDLDKEILALERGDPAAIRMTLALGGRGASIRPDELLRSVFGENASRMSVCREEILLEWNGKLLNPLLAAAVAASDVQRASG